ncbi:very short patch repair endonuclease [Ureibacillus chungkukjangi]|uniref:very short patch repair endonuclease n=1 Tax=Ureibacillus chungkukjangi TaxID=1202712 RepID=UPI000D37C84D|nr:very short patch repair endonuclease [Ureibacillus chungkukjangi]
MADTITKEQRRKNMQAIKSQSKLENKVTRLLWHKGFRFRKNDRTLFVKPDISIKKYKTVIFIDSCFWHVCNVHGNKPKSNQDYWNKKLARNKERDLEVTAYYKEKGWFIKRIWEHQVKGNLVKTVEELAQYIKKARESLLK